MVEIATQTDISEDKSFQVEPMDSFEIEIQDYVLEKKIKITVSEGHNIIRFKNKKPRFNFYIKEGKLEGKYTAYYPNGKIAEIRNCKNGERIGSFSKYSPSGKIRISFTAANKDDVGYQNGMFYQYNEYGTAARCPIVNGEEHGWKNIINGLDGSRSKILMIHGKEETTAQWFRRVFFGDKSHIPADLKDSSSD